MSIAPYTSFEVTDLSSNKQPYVNCTTEFGYFGNIGLATADRCNSMPTFLLTNNGIATVDASGLSILQPGIYTLNVAIDCSAANITTGGNFSMQFNFGTTRLVNVLIGGIIDSFGQDHTIGVFSFSNNAPTYPGIISWLIDDGTSGSNTTVSNYVLGGSYIWYRYNTNCNIDRSFKSGILTTKITFIIDNPTTIYFNTFCSLALTMGTSYFTLKVVQTFKAYTWTEQSASGIRTWDSIASSSDGVKLAAVVYNTGGIYTSTNSGLSWTQQTVGIPNPANWRGIASSSDGTRLAALLGGGNIYISTNSGDTWNSYASPLNWSDIASNSTGQYLVAIIGGTSGAMWKSSNYGLTWNQQTVNIPLNANWTGIASSSDGSKLAACASTSGFIYTSSNFGVNWTTNNNSSGARGWSDIASSSDGVKLAAVVQNGGIYTSTNSGVTWTLQTGGLPDTAFWDGIVSSSDGSILAAFTTGGGSSIWTSSNSGATWSQQTAAVATTYWTGIASSSDGKKLAACGPSGYIFTGVLANY